ncbi:hypothetical protein EDB92DRAFT_1796860 [Lactarius akahatsu]|uniref:Uncharacterized protein n=1 Tax=Lactarius akahatsu TaxID=416441 RepID=A0AAD4LGX1_9AGAM|nr:hypothetical protein EDB92DRAFT_1796860 [Lactarius akahatsu]
MDPKTVCEHLALQMQIYALKYGGMVSDSTLSPSSTPFPEPEYNPWKFLQTSNALGRRSGGIADSTASMHLSPSHQPVPLPPLNLRRRSETHLPRRVESTQPRDTSPELLLGGETASDFNVRNHQSELYYQPPSCDESAENEDKTDADDGEWVDEDVGNEGVANDLLQLEFHADYVSDPEKRRQRWKLRWEALLREFHALDRETDTTLVLLAAPFHTGKLHLVASRAVRCNSSLKSTDMANIRSAFAEMAARRHASRPASLLEQLSLAFSSSSDGPSSRSSDAREKGLRCALDTAIGGLHTLGSLYEQREMRWIEEKLRLDEDKEKVQLLLKQVLGVGAFGNFVNTAL